MSERQRWTRREFLKTAGGAAIGGAATTLARAGRGAASAPTAKPNVVLIITDDQGYGDLGCHGNTVIRTPNLDRLHGESVRLTDFHVAPTCSPTRAGLMTGRSSNRTGVWHTIMGRSLLRADEVTMADVFAAGGYRTGVFGKWHLGDNYPFRPQDRGFQEALVHGGGGVGQTPDYWGNDYFDDTYWQNGRPTKFSGYCTDIWFEGAMRFIEACARKREPFFCYLSTNAPHSPYRVPQKYSDLYKGDANAAFYGMITNIDENVGRLEKRLADLGIADNTILLFLTDNGTSGSGFNAGMRGRKGSEFDGGHRVPCFLRWPAGVLCGGRDIKRLSANLDLLPTLIDLCGLAAPEGVRFEGTSLAPLLFGKGEWPDRALVVDSQRVEHPEKWRQCAVMTDRWRLVNGKELYDIQADPGQKNDVAAANADAVNRLRKVYEDWWAETSVRFDEDCEIVLGSDRENPSRLTCHDWRTTNVPWNQGAIRSGPAANGFWAVQVARDGRYEVALRRWPEEADAPITAAIEGGKAIRATRARLKIGEVDETRPLGPDAKAAVFTVNLKAGKTRLETWFTDEGGESRGAFYAYVKRLEA